MILESFYFIMMKLTLKKNLQLWKKNSLCKHKSRKKLLIWFKVMEKVLKLKN
jgi:hypothetical protein